MLGSKHQNPTPMQFDTDDQSPRIREADSRVRALQSFLEVSAEYLDIEGSEQGR